MAISHFKDNKPAKLNLIEDYRIISVEYDKFWNFDYDVYHIDYLTFYSRVFQLSGNVEHLLKARSILLKEVKSTSKEESIWAFKFMTPEIKNFLELKEKESGRKRMDTILSKEVLDLQAKKNRERRIGLLKMKGGTNGNNGKSNLHV